MRRYAVLFAGLCAVLGTVGCADAATILFNQPSGFPTGQLFNQSQALVFASREFDLGLAFDNFVLGQAASIIDVHWQGAYFNPSTRGTISAFKIQFWADSDGRPGTSLYSAVIAGNANETFVGNHWVQNAPVYDYSTSLATAFAADAGTTYWLSIQAQSPWVANAPTWGWQDSVYGAGDRLSVLHLGGGLFNQSVDRTFSLSGDVVPEPSTLIIWSLLGASGIGIGWWRRKRGAA
jgi:hypothetical protein